MKHITVYDLQMRRVALLENAFAISYEQPFNSLWKGSFSLPADDPKNAECLPLRYVELYDGEERVDLFRIIPTETTRGKGPIVTYQLEHVLATLLDDVLFGYHTVGNLGVYTADVLQYILGKQTTARWQLGTVSFGRQFEYNWENENLLGALWSVVKPFVEGYAWTWDTKTFPWTLNLVPAEADVSAYIRYGRNMVGITKTEDPTDLCTRLYPLGYGEGVNQLMVSEVNGGKPYLDAPTQSQYGVISKIWVDRRYQYPETLLAAAQALLEQWQVPAISYRVDGAELYRLTKDPIDRFRSGSLVRVIDEELGIDITTRVMNRKRPDINRQPGAVQLEIANRTTDLASVLSDLSSRTRVNEVYAQGSTNLNSHDFADNCDPTHPAVLRFWLPEETARINKVRLSYRCEAFRAYERALSAAPAVSSGPSSTSTTASAPAVSSGPSSSITTASAPAVSSGPSSINTTENAGQSVETIDAYVVIEGETPEPTRPAGGHNHGIPVGTLLAVAGGGSVQWNPYPDHYHGMYMHGHVIELPAHSHRMDHTHQIPAHTHGMDHTHVVPAHTHGMDHTHQIPSHTHGIEYGIFEGPAPASVVVTVDGNDVPGVNVNEDDLDLIPFLSKDGGGKVQRGRWVEIKITPDNLGRVVATVTEQIFVQSRGGGDY